MLFDIEGVLKDNDKVMGTLSFNDLTLYINLPSWIEERNVYDLNKKQKAIIKPKKFGGLSYKILDIIDEYAKIKTVDFGECLIKITQATVITNKPQYKGGNY